MAGTNTDWAHGLIPIRGEHDAAPEGTPYPLKQAIRATTPYQTAIYKGQPVRQDTTYGFLVGLATTNATFAVGVAAEYYAGSAVTKTELLVWDSPTQEYLCQMNNTDGTFGNIGDLLAKHCTIASATAGSTHSGISGIEASSAVTSAIKFLRIVDVKTEAGGSKILANAKVVVRIAHSKHWENLLTGSLG